MEDPQGAYVPNLPTTQVELHRALVEDALTLENLIDRLTPIVHARIARVLLRGGARPNLRQVIEDLAQDVFLQLFADGGKALRQWDPDRGLSLENFVGLLAERRAFSTLRRLSSNPWTEEATDSATLDNVGPTPDPERAATARQDLRHLLYRLREELSPLGWRLFQLLFLHELPVAEIGRLTQMSHDAIYAWRSRLRRLVRRLQHEPEMPVPRTVLVGREERAHEPR